jgi:hypothetical protein
VIRYIGSLSALGKAGEIAEMADASKPAMPEAEALTTQSATVAAPVRKARRIIRKAEWAELIVDVWITNFHSVKFGLYKHSRNQAKSRQFTSDMDIFAEVIVHGERTGLLGYREELWRKHAGMDRRLVLKLFNETLNWRASMDLMIGRSLQLTLGARGLPVTAFSINAGDHDDVGTDYHGSFFPGELLPGKPCAARRQFGTSYSNESEGTVVYPAGRSH